MTLGRPQGSLPRWSRAALTAVLFAGLLTAAAQHQPPAVTHPAAPAASPKRLVADEAELLTTESEAFAEAEATGQPVEVGAYRGERQEVFANPDGTLTSVQHAQPVRVIGDDGQWVDVDSTLIVGADGRVMPRASTLGIRLSNGGSGPLIEVERAGRTLSIGWPGALPTPTLWENTATFVGVLPDVDLVVVVSPSGFSHVLVIKTPEAGANPALAELRLNLESAGLSTAVTADGGVATTDVASGGTVFEAGAPMMWDSTDEVPEGETEQGGVGATAAAISGETGDATMAAYIAARATEVKSARFYVKAVAKSLYLVPDQTMLTDPNTKWPVYVDPVWEATTSSTWAMAASGYPRQPYWKFPTTEGLGRCPVSSGYCNGVGVKRLFYGLPTPFAGKNILSAEFRVTMTHTYSNSMARRVDLYRAGGSIGPGTSWNNMPSMATLLDSKSPTATQGVCTPSNQNVGFNATGVVQEAAANGWANTTFGMKAADEGDSTAWKRFCGNAILSVRYNRAPDQPVQASLTSSPGGVCASGDARPYVSTPPTLYMVLTDPDSTPAHVEQVSGEVSLTWEYPAGTKNERILQTGSKASGSPFEAYTQTEIPQNTVISWRVRASDGMAWSPWSLTCEFIYDRTRPAAADIDSADYLPGDAADTTSKCVTDDRPRGSIGVYSTFTFASLSTDTVKYRYGFNRNPLSLYEVVPAVGGGPVSVSWMPKKVGPNFITVQAVDRAGLTSTISSCVFTVGRRFAVGEWSFGEQRGASAAADTKGDHPATPGTGATFGAPGPGCQYMNSGCEIDWAVALTGAADSYLTTATSGLVDTVQGFSVAAWVRVTDLSRDQVAVSQDGSGEPGFTLGYSAATKKWTFGTPVSDITALGGWTASSTLDALPNTWTHLVGIYDPGERTLALYVNGNAQPAAARRSAWKSRGAVQIGRAIAKSGYRQRWVGELADVALFDRVMVPNEIADLSEARPVRKAYWQLNSETNGVSPEIGGGEGLRLSGGARIAARSAHVPLLGSGDLELDGVDDVASTTRPIVTTDGSFTVSFRVRTPSRPTRPMAVISQAGTNNSGFVVRLTPEGWQLTVPASDATGAASVTVSDSNLDQADSAPGQSVIVVYNAFTQELQLYIDGQLANTATGIHANLWKANGGLQIGRALIDGSWKDYFSGEVDDVRVYAGATDRNGVNQLARYRESSRL